MPPRIRSPSPDYSDGSDQLDDSPVLASRPLPRVTLTASTSRPPPPPPAPAPELVDDDASLSSLSSDDASSSPAPVGSGSVDYVSDEPSDGDDDIDDGDAFEDDGLDDDDDEYDELDDAPASKKQSTASYTPANSGVKIKFKLGGASAVASLKPPSAKKASGSSSSKKGKGKSKRRAEDDFSDSPPPSDGDLSDSGSLDSSFSGGVRLTARQRAKEMGGPNGMELQSLPNLKGGIKPTVKLTEAEVALRRSENSRKRKHQSDKRLEDEKTETINRLLKKQVGRQRSKLSTTTTNPNNQSKVDGDEDGAPVPEVYVPPPVIPRMLRWTSSVRTGEYVTSLAVPVDNGEMSAAPARPYPGPRPPLKTRRLVC